MPRNVHTFALLIDLKNRDECDATARVILHSGSKGGHLPIFRRGQELVLQRCTKVASQRLYEMALITATTNRKSNIIEALLETDVTCSLEKLTEVLELLCAWGSEKILVRFLRRDTDMLLGTHEFSIGLRSAVRENNHQVVLYWIRKHPDRLNLTVDPKTIIEVAENGFIDILPLLVESLTHIDAFESTINQCLQAASSNGHEEVMQYFIAKGADVNTIVEGKSALQAALNGFACLDSTAGTQIRRKRQLKRTEVAVLSQKRTVELLLAKGADPNKAAKHERYPLNIAAANCPVEIVQALISSGAHIGAATKQHGTALCAAAHRKIGSLPIINALLEASAVASIDDLGRAAALHQALSFFDTSDQNRYNDDVKFLRSDTIREVLSTGPGAAVRILLYNLPEANAKGRRYHHLAQMACVVGDLEYLKLLLERGIDVNGLGHYYGTALQAASRFGNTEIVECLLTYGSDVNIIQGAHGTALRAAVLGGHEDVTRSLIVHGADANLRCEREDRSILHLALKARNCSIFEALLDAGADMNTEVANQTHIIIAACVNGDASFVELLLAKGADPNTPGIKQSYYNDIHGAQSTPLNTACSRGHLSVTRLLLHHGANVENSNQSSATPLIVAIGENSLAVVKLLLDAGADANHAISLSEASEYANSEATKEDTGATFDHLVDTTPLSEAAKYSNLEIIQELLSAGAIVGGPFASRNELAEACKNCQYRVVEVLLESLSGGQNEIEICNEALAAAIKGGDHEVISLLLECGVSPSIEMLHLASSAGALEVLKLLVDTGIDINRRDADDATPIHVAACLLRPNIVHFLIKAGANVMFRSEKYGTPLISVLEGSVAPFLRYYEQPESCQPLASQLPFPGLLRTGEEMGGGTWSRRVTQCEQIVQSLFNAGAEVDIISRPFGNALHLASYLGSETIVGHMLDKIEDVNTFGGYFGSPLIAAVKGNHPSIVELLLRRAVDVNYHTPEHGFALLCACAHGNKQMIQNILDHGADINAHDDEHGSALAAAASSGSGGYYYSDVELYEKRLAVVELLLCHKPEVHIRECDLLAAASWSSFCNSKDLVSRFLRHDQTAVATEVVTVKFIEKYSKFYDKSEIMMQLLEHDRGLGTTPNMLKATKDVEIMDILLKHKPVCRVTADVLESAAEQSIYSTELVKLLLAHSTNITITDATIIAAMGNHNGSTLRELLDHDKEMIITDEVLEAVEDRDIMNTLLQRRTENQKITSDILERAAERHWNGASLISLLLQHDNSLTITPPVVHSAMKSSGSRYEFLRTILKHDPSLTITEEDMTEFITTYHSYEDERNGEQPEDSEDDVSDEDQSNELGDDLSDEDQSEDRWEDELDENIPEGLGAYEVKANENEPDGEGPKKNVTKKSGLNETEPVEDRLHAQTIHKENSEEDEAMSEAIGDEINQEDSGGDGPDEGESVETIKGTIGLLMSYGKTMKFTAKITEALKERFPKQSDQVIKERFYRLEKR